MDERPKSLEELGDRYQEELEAHLREGAIANDPHIRSYLELANSLSGEDGILYVINIHLDIIGSHTPPGSIRSCAVELGRLFEDLGQSEFNKYFYYICKCLELDLPAPGAHLGKHVLEEVVGVGGMGVVYRARDDALKQDWAIKVILAGEDGGGSGTGGEADRSNERLRNEARLTAKLNGRFHGRFLTVTDLEESHGHVFYRMDYIRGSRSLVTEVRSNGGPLENLRAARLLRECAESVREAHSLGIIHRDLKAANVLLTGDGHARVTDFGLAKELSSAVEGHVDVGVSSNHSGVAGTLACMAPEQLLGEADHKSDVYGLGAIGYFLLTGRQPFYAVDDSKLLELVRGERQPEPPLKHNAQADPRLAKIVMKCLAKDPTERYGSAQELVVELEKYEEDSTDEPIRGTLIVGFPLLGIVCMLGVYLALFGRSSPPTSVLSNIVAYQKKCPTTVWDPLPVDEIEDVPDPDYRGFDVRVDSRFWDLSLWHRSASPVSDPERSFMTRVIEVKRRRGDPANRFLPFHFRTSGMSVNPKCSEVVDHLGRVFKDPAFQAVQRGKRKKKLADGSREMTAYQLILDLGDFPEGEPIKVVVHGVYVNSFQGRVTEFATARIDAPVEVAQLSVLFPRSMTFKEYELFEHPGGADTPRQNAQKLGMPRADPDNGMFGWTIRQRAGVNAYDFQWEWEER